MRQDALTTLESAAVTTDEPILDEHPDDCSCLPSFDDLPCWPCFHDDFETPTPGVEEQSLDECSVSNRTTIARWKSTSLDIAVEHVTGDQLTQTTRRKVLKYVGGSTALLVGGTGVTSAQPSGQILIEREDWEQYENEYGNTPFRFVDRLGTQQIQCQCPPSEYACYTIRIGQVGVDEPEPDDLPEMQVYAHPPDRDFVSLDSYYQFHDLLIGPSPPPIECQGSDLLQVQFHFLETEN